jgi:hypothetical protein
VPGSMFGSTDVEEGWAAPAGSGRTEARCVHPIGGEATRLRLFSHHSNCRRLKPTVNVFENVCLSVYIKGSIPSRAY